MAHTYQITIREGHLDTFGHMNNAAYSQIYEEARWELITNKGFGIIDIQANKLGPVILELNIKFLKEIKLREQISIRTEYLGTKGLISQLRQQMIKADGAIASEAVFTFGLFDMNTRKLIMPSKEWLAAIDC